MARRAPDLCQSDAPPLPLPLYEPRRGYRFRPENLVLPALLERAPTRCIIDLGAGSGSLGLLADHATGRKAERVILVERNADLAAFARQNAERIAGERGIVIEHDVRTAELPPASLVVANPPFFEPGEGRPSRHRSTREATHAHHGGVAEFAAAAARALDPDGDAWFLYPADRLDRALESLAWAGLCAVELVNVHAPCRVGAYRCWIRARRSGAGAPLAVRSVCAFLSVRRGE